MRRVGGVFGTHLRALTQPGSPLVGSEDSTHPTTRDEIDLLFFQPDSPAICLPVLPGPGASIAPSWIRPLAAAGSGHAARFLSLPPSRRESARASNIWPA